MSTLVLIYAFFLIRSNLVHLIPIRNLFCPLGPIRSICVHFDRFEPLRSILALFGPFNVYGILLTSMVIAIFFSFHLKIHFSVFYFMAKLTEWSVLVVFYHSFSGLKLPTDDAEKFTSEMHDPCARNHYLQETTKQEHPTEGTGVEPARHRCGASQAPSEG